MVGLRQFRTNAKKLDGISSDIFAFVNMFDDIIEEQKEQRVKLKMVASKMTNYIDKVVQFSKSKRDPSAFNLFVKNESSKMHKQGKTSGGPAFLKDVSSAWKSLPEKRKNEWTKKTRSGKSY